MALHKALNNCLINFDRRVLVTDLLEEYKLTYKEVHEMLEAYITKQEKCGEKYDKRYCVYGEEQETTNEIYAIVQGESKLHEWLRKLKNSESTLYSVEIAGGAKAPAQILKPMKHCAIKLKNLEERDSGSSSFTNTTEETKTQTTKPNIFNKVEPKPAAKQATEEAKRSPPNVASLKTEGVANKQSPSNSSTTSSKATTKTTVKKGSISNFFTATKAENKTEVKSIKPTTPKKMQDFFKKQTDAKLTTIDSDVQKIKKEEKQPKSNTSVQLFADEEVESSSSEEEEKLEHLRKDIITSDTEETTPTGVTAAKRRRICDTDDEDEQPQQKQKQDEGEAAAMLVDQDVEEQSPPQPKSETYLDEEGFVITVKSKKASVAPKKPAAIKKKISPQQKSKLSGASSSGASSAKTKQGSITSFFKKK